MDRRTALAVSVSMMATVAVGTLAFAALGGMDVLGFGTEAASAPVEIVETSPTTAPANGEAPPAATTTTLLGEQPGTTIAGGSTPTENGSGAVTGPGATTPRATTPATAAPGTAAPTTVAATTPVTAAPTTVTVPRTTTPATSPPPASTLPPGVPKDWPAGVPIPPKPPGCVDGQLEDNGVWNCQH